MAEFICLNCDQKFESSNKLHDHIRRENKLKLIGIKQDMCLITSYQDHKSYHCEFICFYCRDSVWPRNTDGSCKHIKLEYNCYSYFSCQICKKCYNALSK